MSLHIETPSNQDKMFALSRFLVPPTSPGIIDSSMVSHYAAMAMVAQIARFNMAR